MATTEYVPLSEMDIAERTRSTELARCVAFRSAFVNHAGTHNMDGSALTNIQEQVLTWFAQAVQLAQVTENLSNKDATIRVNNQIRPLMNFYISRFAVSLGKNKDPMSNDRFLASDSYYCSVVMNQ